MGIMGGKNYISNIEIKGREFHRLKSVCERYFGIKEVSKILYVVEGKHVYEIIVDDKKSFRLDIYEQPEKKLLLYYKKKYYYQKLAYDNGVNVPKIIGVQEAPEGFYKLSDWIKGVRVGEVWNMPHMFKCAGHEIAKINSIKDSCTDCFLGYNDFNKPNAIWTKQGDLYLIDIEIQPKKSVTGNVVKMLLKNIKDKDRIRWFLKGYREIRNVYEIEKMLKEKNYKW